MGFIWREYDTAKDGSLVYTYEIHTSYSMVLTGASFLHKAYLRMYTESLPYEVDKMVGDFVNCEDIAMNFLVSHHCRCSAPYKVYVDEFTVASYTGLSNQNSKHTEERSTCSTKFTYAFGRNPLISKSSDCMWY